MLIKIGYIFFLIDADEDTFYSSFVGWQKFVQYIRMLYLGFIDLNRTVGCRSKVFRALPLLIRLSWPINEADFKVMRNTSKIQLKLIIAFKL